MHSILLSYKLFEQKQEKAEEKEVKQLFAYTSTLHDFSKTQIHHVENIFTKLDS